MTIIYDQFGRPYKQKKKPFGEILGAAALTDAYRDYVADGLTPQRLAGLLKQADTGELARQAELFDQIEERDGHIIGEISKRRNVILDADFTLEPASEDKRDVAVYEACKKMMDSITDWPDTIISLQDAVGKGFSSLEMHWDVSEGQAQVGKFTFIEQKRFRFCDETGLFSRIPRLITDNAPLGIDIPPFRTILHRYGGKSGHAARSGIYRICAWWYLFKNYSIKDWVVFCEVFGMPLRLGKYQPGASEEDKKALETAVALMGHDAAGIISTATEIEFPTGNKTNASVDLYERLAGFANKEMSKAILGGTLTADVDGKGSYAAANTHNDVRHDLINADARSIAATVRDQFIRPWVGYNYGWDTPVPKYTGRFQSENLQTHAELLDKFADRLDIPVSHVRNKFGIPAPEKEEETLRPKMAVKKAFPLNASRHIATQTGFYEKNQDFPVMITNDLAHQADPELESMVDNIKNLLDESADLEEFRERLIDAWKDMDTAVMAHKIEQAMTIVDLAGRYEVKTNG